VVLADGRRGFALRITVPFGADVGSLGPGVTGRLREIGETLKGYPESRVLIQGHTALTGTMAGRVRIAQERTQAAAEFLVAGGYVRRDQIELQALGAEQPLDSNMTDAGWEKNRRVIIIILQEAD
jgi:outer membrane protein OmpA-like peptidoglycan-associated protein